MKAFTPEVASGNTSSPVKLPPAPSVRNSSLKAPTVGPSGAQRTGTQQQAHSFVQPTHSYGNSTIAVTHEQRSGGVPHMPMIAKIGKI